MDNIVEYYKKIEEYKNLMLKSYKNLIVAYEESRQLYEKEIAKYESTPVMTCSKIMADNKAWVTTKWQLIGASGDVLDQILYESGKYQLGETMVLDLRTDVPIADGTTFYLKANVQSGDDSKSSVILVYDPTSNNTAYFELTGTAFKTTLTYKGIL